MASWSPSAGPASAWDLLDCESMLETSTDVLMALDDEFNLSAIDLSDHVSSSSITSQATVPLPCYAGALSTSVGGGGQIMQEQMSTNEVARPAVLNGVVQHAEPREDSSCLLYTSPSPRDS